MKILILVTGGTIDGLEYDSEEKAPKNHKSIVNNLLDRAQVKADYNLEVLMQKDSRFITDSDREFIAAKCRESKIEKIVITHGTLTMPITAKYLGQLKIPKTIILTGSLVLGYKPESDALFNLGAAITIVQSLPAGVYVAMNGGVFRWDNVKKESGYFQKEIS